MEGEKQLKESTTGASNPMNMPITFVDVQSDSSSETDFELDEEFETAIVEQEVIAVWNTQLKQLLEFSEDILPTVLYEPMKVCYVSIRYSLKHIARLEEMLHYMDKDSIQLLERNLEAWKRLQQTSTSKSRLLYSISMYKYAGDVFYFAFYQNPGIASEIRAQMEAVFEAEFGSTRLHRTRSLLKVFLRQFSQIEDFLSMLPEIYRSEVRAGLICDYLNPISRDDEDGVVLAKMNELVSSPDYHENQIILMLLTRQDCVFKQVILDSLMKYLITDPLLQNTTTGGAASTSTAATTMASTTNMMTTVENYETGSCEDLTRYRLKIFLEAEPNLLVKACLSTDNYPTSLFDIIATALDTISVKITRNRSQIFKDFRPPLFDKDNHAAMSLPEEFFTFFQKMKEAPESTCSLLDRIKNALSKTGRTNYVNRHFWQELFVLLSESRSKFNNIHQNSFEDIYNDLCRY